MHELPILINIVLALGTAFVGGLIARRLGLPTIVGYLLAGVVIGPFTPGVFGDVKTIHEFAELGVIFLLFGVGLHFSLRDLWNVRDTAIMGALLQMLITTAIGIVLTQFWGWSWVSGLVLGLAVSIASTVVLLRNLMDEGLLSTTHGQVAVGWLVLEDLATVLILVLLPAFSANASGSLLITGGIALLKAVIFAALMLVVGTKFIPWLLKRMAYLRSRELFIVAIVVITVGTGLGASYLFGVSLALGAFLAGVVINESVLSHQVEAEVLPFREIFSVLFFVSIGMLVNPGYLWANIGQVVGLVLLIVVGKFILTLALGIFFPRPARTFLVIAAGLCQIGEFSFILGQAGVSAQMLTQDQYSLILAGAMISITVNPFVFRCLPWVEEMLRKIPSFWSLLDRHGPAPIPIEEGLSDHVVVIGCGRVGWPIVRVLNYLEVPCLVVEIDVGIVVRLQQQDIPVLYGDAANSEILKHAHLDRARVIVVTVADEAAAEVVTAAAKSLAERVPLIVRASTREGMKRLFTLGGQEVILPELVGGLEITQQTLIRLGYSEKEIQKYVEAIRHDRYDIAITTEDEQEALAQMRTSGPGPHPI